MLVLLLLEVEKDTFIYALISVAPNEQNALAFYTECVIPVVASA